MTRLRSSPGRTRGSAWRRPGGSASWASRSSSRAATRRGVGPPPTKLGAEGIEGVEAVRFDVTRPEDHKAIARFLEDRYGKLDILVNNAGVALEDAAFGAPGGFNTTTSVKPEILRQVFETNFFAAWR